MRIDKLLYALRFAKTRGVAQRWIGEGHMRRNGARVVRQDLAIVPGDVLTLPLRARVLVIEVVELPLRRGPAHEAQACYRVLDGGAAKAIGAGHGQTEGTATP